MKTLSIDEMLANSGIPSERQEQMRLLFEEMIRSNSALARGTKPVVTIWGSARNGPDSPEYQSARKIGRLCASNGYDVMTGGGPGIMQAGNEGAISGGAEHSIGLNLRASSIFESDRNYFQTEGDVLYHHDFGSRLWTFVEGSSAIVVCPGGLGTWLELAYVLCSVQCGTHKEIPIILIDQQYWGPMVDKAFELMSARGYVGDTEQDMMRHLVHYVAIGEEHEVPAIIAAFGVKRPLP